MQICTDVFEKRWKYVIIYKIGFKIQLRPEPLPIHTLSSVLPMPDDEIYRLYAVKPYSAANPQGIHLAKTTDKSN
ncbi:hypothetical protein FBS47_05775 [Neisseria gonorrhoeae]